MKLTADELMEIFSWGVDYGLLLAEEERESEQLFDAFNGAVKSRKYAMPTHPIPSRQIRSQAWIEAKQNSYRKFLDIYVTEFAKTRT